ncbi:putative Ig domain-containing protein [Spirosoma soli]|uniref:Ig domain-containing protein n=1 Tax=Spirosoma soli TaxID=1770529 RepID=A0ABW5MA54_9BACT
MIVGQSGKLGLGGDGNGGGGGGGGGSAIVLTHSGVQTLLVAAGGGGGGGQRYYRPGGGGQGLGPSTGGVGAQNYINADGNFSGGGGGGGLDGPGGNGISGYFPGGTGGGAASLTALSVGGTYRDGIFDGAGGSGFGGGGALGGRDKFPGEPVGGGGGGYGGGDGGSGNALIYTGATGGYSYVSPAGSNTSVTPGISGISRNRDGIATIDFSQNTATAAITTTNLVVCDGSFVNIEGTVNAKGNWTIVLSNGIVGTGSGSTFSIPVSSIEIVSSYPYLTIESLLDDQGFAPVSNLIGQASITVNKGPRPSLTNNGPITCAQSSVTLTASGATSYTFTIGSLPLAGDPASNTRVVTSPGTYLVVGSLNGCTNSATTTVTSLGIVVVNPATALFVVGQAVSQAFTASGGVSGSPDRPYSFSVASGSLPPGLSLSADGQLSGSPTQTGSFPVVIQATDANSCTGFGTSYVINVTSFSLSSQPPASLLVCADNPVSVSVGVSGTPTAYQWYKDNTLVSGQTSATLSLASVSTADAGSYVVVITGEGQSLTSTAVNLTVGPSVPARLYVNASATGANTGLDWANAFTDLQSALSVGNACSNNLKEIWVAGGVYKPTPTGNRNVFFPLLSGVALYGGFVGNETALSQRPSVNPNLGGASKPSSSTLSGDIGQPGNDLDNSLVVVAGADLVPTTVLDGFVITGGRAEAPNVPIGGGLTNVTNTGSSSPTLTNLFFINNYGANIGGAILNYGAGSAASPTISNCRFEQNTAGVGGAIANYTTSGNSVPVITNCFFGGNSATQWGGAIANVSFGGTLSPAITNCAFQSNSATQGGALWQATIQAGVLNALITNCSFGGNRAGEGGALYNSTSFPGSPAGGSIGLTLANSVLFDNGGASTLSNTGEVTLATRYNLFDSAVTGYTSGEGNRATATSPFASPTSLLLGSGSPAINMGDNGVYQTAGGPPTDLGGGVRIQQTTIDMGAYETGDQTPCPPLAFTAPLASGSAVCVGGSVQVTGTLSGTPTTYQWYKDGAPLATQTGATLSLTGLQTTDAGAYALVVTDGCNPAAPTSLTSTAFSLTVSAAPAATILVPSGGALSCAQPVLSLTAIGGDTYRWEDNSTSAVRSVSVAGTYSVTATTSPGCSATATTTITSSTALITVTNPGQTTATLGAPFSQPFTATGGTGGPYSFSLASGSLPPGLSLSAAGVLSGSATQAGSFTVVVQAQDSGGCVGVSTYILLVSDTSPTLSLANVSVSPASVCVGTWVTFTATVANVTGSYGYTLTNGTSTSTGTSSNPAFSQTLVASGSGVQSFTLTVSSAGQSATATTTLTVNAPPSPTLSASNGGLLTCTQTSLTLTAGGGATYTFGGPGVVNQTGNTAIVNASGTYSVTVTSTETGCSSTTTTTVTSTTDAPAVSISASATALSCASPTVSLTALGTGSVRWSTGETSPSISVSAAGAYSVTLTSGGSCTATASVTIDSQPSESLSFSQQPASASSVAPGTTVTTTVSVSSSGPLTYQWYKDNLATPVNGQTTATLSLTNVQLTDVGSYSVVVTGSCNIGTPTSLTSTAFALSVTAPNTAPTLANAISSQTATVGQSYSISLANTFTDQETPNSLSLSVSGLPTGLTLVGTTLSGTPSVSGVNTVMLTATDPGSLTASTSFVLTVSPASVVNTAPTVVNAISSQTATVGQPFVLNLASTFADQETPNSLSLSVSGLPAGLSLVGTTLSGTPSVSGISTVMLTATDPGSLSVSTSFVLTVSPASVVNTAPTVVNAISSQTATVGQSYSISLAGSFTDQETPNSLTLLASGLPTGLTLVGTTLSGTPSVSGISTVVLTATDPGSLSVSTSFVLTVSPAPLVNTAPTLVNAISSQTATVGVVYSLNLANTFTDQETPNSLSLSASGLPAGLSLVGTTLSGTPSVSGVSTLTLTATDPGSLSASTSFVLTVSPASSGTTTAPFAITSVSTISCTPVGDRINVSFAPQYTGTTGQPISFSVVNELLPTPEPGPYTLSLYTDNPTLTLSAQQAGVTTSYVYNWLAACQTSQATNTPPRVVTLPSPQTATLGQGFAYVVPANTFTDSETPLNVVLSAQGVPAGLRFTGTTLTGTPSTTVGSPYSISLTATDPGGLSVTTLLALVVLPGSSPVEPGSPFSITGVTTLSCTPVGDRINLSFAPQYAGLNGQAIAFEVINEQLPTSSPAPYSLSLYRDNPVLQLRATQSGTASPASFSYNWLAACASLGQDNTPPVVNRAIANQTATVGQPFELNFINTFIDQETPGGLTYAVSGLPSGLRLENTSILGVPQSMGVSSITLTATDLGGLSTSVSFFLSVEPAEVSALALVVQATPTQVTVGGSTTLTAQASGGTVPYSFSFTGPGAVRVAGNVAVFSNLPLGEQTFTVVVGDASGPSAQQLSVPVSVTVVAPSSQTQPGGESFALTGAQTVSCEVVRADLRRVTFTPQYTGLSGEPVSFSVVNEQLPTTAPGPYTLNLYTDNPLITLSAQQGSTTTTYVYSWLTACPAQPGGRLGTGADYGSGLQVRVLGNPIEGQMLDVEIRGVAGQRVRVELVDMKGYPLHSRQIEQAAIVEPVRLGADALPAVFLVQVSTATQRQTVKVIKAH